MSRPSILQVIAGVFFLVLLTSLFVLYQNPLFEFYLSSWGLC
jgi:hypothetical protein